VLSDLAKVILIHAFESIRFISVTVVMSVVNVEFYTNDDIT